MGKILSTHLSLNSQSGKDLYSSYMDYIRAKYRDEFVDSGLPFVTPYEDTFQGWSESRRSIGESEEELTNYIEIKDDQKLLGE